MWSTTHEASSEAVPSAALHSRGLLGPESDTFVLDGLELTFRHVLSRRGNGRTEMAHTLKIDGPGPDEVGAELGPQISADFPVAMAELLGAAERGVHV